MQVEGQRVKRRRWIRGGTYIVEVEVDAVIPIDDPSEACYEPQTVAFLREVQQKAEAGELEWLKRVGTVYARVPA